MDEFRTLQEVVRERELVAAEMVDVLVTRRREPLDILCARPEALRRQGLAVSNRSTHHPALLSSVARG